MRGILADLLVHRARGAGAPAGLSDEERRRLEGLGYLASGAGVSGLVEPGREDPKDLLAFHLANLTVPPLIVQGELAEATRRSKELLARRPDFADARVYLARIAREEGRFDDAIVHYEAALEIGPLRPGLLTDLGVVLARAGRHPDSTRRYRDAIEIDPDHVEARNNLGNALLAAGETGEALAHYRRALELRPDSAETRINMAIAYLRMNDTAAALEQLAIAEAGLRETDRALLELLASAYAAAGRPDREAEIRSRIVVEGRQNE
jgi:tetratricopeptide (TPR) repeat protein